MDIRTISSFGRRLTMARFARTFTIGTVIGICGCSGPPHTSIRLIEAIDVSDRTMDRLAANALIGYQAQSKLKNNDHLEVVAFAHDLDIVYEAKRIRDRNEFNRVISTPLIKTRPGLLVKSTRTDKAFIYLRQQVAASAEPCVGVVITDGGIEDPGVAKTIQAEVRTLATLKNFGALHVVGVLPQFRRQWQLWLQPLGTRADVRGSNDYQSVISTVPATSYKEVARGH